MKHLGVCSDCIVKRISYGDLSFTECEFVDGPLTLEIQGYRPRRWQRLLLALAALRGKEIARPVVITGCTFTGPPMSLKARIKAVFLGSCGPLKAPAIRIDDKSSPTVNRSPQHPST